MSFFEALLEGGANAAANSLGNHQKRQQMLDDEERNQQQSIERFRQQQQIQQDMAEQARQAKQERLQTQTAQAEESGAKLSRAQALASLNKEYGSNHTEADVLPEELDAYGPDAVGKIDNNLKAALSAGLYDAADSFSAERAATVKAMQDAFNERLKIRKDERDERKTDALVARGSSKGDGNTTFDRQVALLQKAGVNDQGIADFITNRKQESIGDMAFTLLKADRAGGGDLTQEAAIEIAKSFKDMEKQASAKPAPAPAKPQASNIDSPPPTALKNGVHTTFKGKGTWTLVNGVPTRVK